MIDILKKLRRIEKIQDNTGMLTKEDVQKLRQAKSRPFSKYRKSICVLWTCNACNHAYYYSVMRCPMCESDKIKKENRPAIPAAEKQEDSIRVQLE